MSKPKPKPHACDMCNGAISGAGIVVLGMDDGRGLALPAAFQTRSFCGAFCFYRWTDEIRAATSRHERSNFSNRHE